MGQNDSPSDANKHPVTKLGGPFEAPPPPQSGQPQPPDAIGRLLEHLNGPAGAVDCKAVYKSKKDATQITTLEFDSCYYGHTDKNGRSLQLQTPVMYEDLTPLDPAHPEKEKMPLPKLEKITTEGVTMDSRRLDVFEHALPAVRPVSFKNPDGTGAAGTATMIADDGLMITNNHVVKDSKDGVLQVTLLRPDGTEEVRNAHVVMQNPKQDLALLQVDHAPDEKFGWLPFSKNTHWRAGEPTVQMGNANGEGKISMTKSRYAGMLQQSDTKADDPDVFPGRTIYKGQAIAPHGYSGGVVLSVPGSDKVFNGGVHRTGTSAIRGITVYSDLEHTSYFIPAARGQYMLDEYRKQQAGKNKPH
jgi:hypothetical protein